MRVVFACISGSKLHGTSTSASDTDFKGFGFPEMTHLLGIGVSDPTGNWRKISNNLHGSEKCEGTIESLMRQIRFIYDGDLSGTETCFADPKFHVHQSDIGLEICDFAKHHLLSRQLFKSYNGYFKSQVRQIKTRERTGVRKALVDKYGYDVKFAMHAFRLGMQSIEIMATHTFKPTLEGHTLEIARAIRDGQYEYERVLKILDIVDEEMHNSYLKSSLRDEPDKQLIDSYIIDLHLRYIKGEFDRQFVEFSMDDVLNKVRFL